MKKIVKKVSRKIGEDRNRVITDTQEAPPVMKRSRAKIWIRTGILTVFLTLFSLMLYEDISTGVFLWQIALMILLPCLLVGFWISGLVPMQIHIASQHITFSFDIVYFTIIILLVVVKFISSKIPAMEIGADIIMCMIIGMMTGRLSGICLRVRKLKIKHDFIDRDTLLRD